MLSNLIKVHQAKQSARKERQEKKKREAIIAASALTHSLVDHLNAGVANAYVNQKKLDTETKILQSNAAQFSKQTSQWLKLVEDFNTALKEIGDVENWAKSIETDMRTVSSALEYTYKSTLPAEDDHNSLRNSLEPDQMPSNSTSGQMKVEEKDNRSVIKRNYNGDRTAVCVLWDYIDG